MAVLLKPEGALPRIFERNQSANKHEAEDERRSHHLAVRPHTYRKGGKNGCVLVHVGELCPMRECERVCVCAFGGACVCGRVWADCVCVNREYCVCVCKL